MKCSGEDTHIQMAHGTLGASPRKTLQKPEGDRTLGTHLGTGFALGETSEGTRSLLVAGTGCPAGFLSMVCPRAWSKFVAIAKEKVGGPTSPQPGKG